MELAAERTQDKGATVPLIPLHSLDGTKRITPTWRDLAQPQRTDFTLEGRARVSWVSNIALRAMATCLMWEM